MKEAKISVELIDSMGDDLTVVNAARVSMQKHHDKFEDNDESLINYLATNGHWSPFSHCILQFRVKAPIFVARQLFKHQVGLTVNEVSRRYVDSEPEFYIPELRERAEDVKQGSSVLEIKHKHEMLAYLKTSVNIAVNTYINLLQENVAPEVARAVLPQCMMTEWYWTGSLYAFSRVCNLRLEAHAQKESGIVAHKINLVLKEKFPISQRALVRYE